MLKASIPVLICILAAGALACGDPYLEKMPTDPGDKAGLLGIVSHLPDDEQKDLFAYAERIEKSKAMGGEGVPAGTTVRQALDEQRRWTREEGERIKREREEATRKLQEEERQKQEQTEKARKQMLEICSVEVVSKKVTGKKEKDALSAEMFDIDLKFSNKGSKDLTMIIGVIQMADENGKPLKEMKIPYRKALKAGQSATFGGKSRYDPSKANDVALANIPLNKLKVNWEPKVYKFKDGSRLGTEPEPEALQRGR